MRKQKEAIECKCHIRTAFFVFIAFCLKKHHSSSDSARVIILCKKNGSKTKQHIRKPKKPKNEEKNDTMHYHVAKKKFEREQNCVCFVCLSTDLTVQPHIKRERKRKERPPTGENKDRPLQQMYPMRKSAKVVF